MAAAQAKADDLIEELRELVRGIHPRVLTDRGLPEALAELADHSPVPVTLDVDLTGMTDRVAVMGGTMDLSSPVGGPTRIRVELPCTISQTEVRR